MINYIKLIFLISIIIIPTSSALVSEDNFNRIDNTNISLNAPISWYETGYCWIEGNKLKITSDEYCIDQTYFSTPYTTSVKIYNTNLDQRVYGYLQSNTSISNGYYIRFSNSTGSIQLRNSSGALSLNSGYYFNSGDLILIDWSTMSSGLKIYKNGNIWVTMPDNIIGYTSGYTALYGSTSQYYDDYSSNTDIYSIVNYIPSSLTPNSYFGIPQTFIFEVNKISNFTWYLDGNIIQSNVSSTNVSYINTNAPIGIHNVTVYATNGSRTISNTWIWNISTLPIPPESSNMSVIGRWGNGITWDNTYYNGYLYVAAGRQIRIYNVSTYDKLINGWEQINVYPSQTELGTYREKEGYKPVKTVFVDGEIMEIEQDGNYLYIVGAYIFSIINISNPSNAYEESNISLVSSSVRGVEISGNYAYITESGIGLSVINITNKSNPIKITSVNLGGENKPWRFDVLGSYAYVGMEVNHTLVILDISGSNATNPQIISSYTNNSIPTSEGFSGVSAYGNYVYIIEYSYGLRVINVTNRLNPVQSGYYLSDHGIDTYYGRFSDIIVYNSTIAYASRRYGGVDVVDISNPNIPNVINQSMVDPTGPYAEGVTVMQAPYGNFILMSGDSEGMSIYNMLTYSLVGRIWTFGGGERVIVDGNYAYYSGHNEGVWIVDISNSTNPKEVAWVRNYGRNTGMVKVGNMIYTSGVWQKLSGIDVTNPLYPVLKFTGVGFNNLQNQISSDGIYVFTGGELAINISEPSQTYTSVFDVSNPNNPIIVESTNKVLCNYGGTGCGGIPSGNYINLTDLLINGHSGSTEVVTSNFLFLVGDNGLLKVNRSNITNLTEVGRYYGDFSGARTLLENNTLYVSDGNANLKIFNVSGNIPYLMGGKSSGAINAIAKHNTTLFTMPRLKAWGNLSSWNISNVSNPVFIDSIPVYGNGYAADLYVSEGLLYNNKGDIIYIGIPGSIKTPILKFGTIRGIVRGI